MLHISQAILVEGKYDKQKLQTVTDALVLSTDGFRLFRDPEKRSLICRLAKTRGLIVLTDSDVAGFHIRNHVKSITKNQNVIHLYIPQTKGKEKRKPKESKEGLLGVEGMPAALLTDLLAPYAIQEAASASEDPITKLDLWEAGLSGGTDSKQKRLALLAHLNLPSYLTTNALLPILNTCMRKSEFRQWMAQYTAKLSQE